MAGTFSPPKTKKAEATRQRIVEAAAEIFDEQGYEQAALVDVAAAAGVTKGAIYGHFRNKAELLVACLTQSIEEQAAREQEVHGTERETEVLTELLIGKRFRRHRALNIDADAAARHDETIAGTMHEAHEELLARLRDRLQEGEDAGLIDDQLDPDALSYVLLAMAAGVGRLEVYGVKPPTAKKLSETLALLISK